MIDLKGKAIAITGASSGIGMVTALECARAGMPVAVGARRADRLDDLVARIRGEGGRAIAVPCDVDRPEDCRALVDATVREFGGIYSVFANAGYGTYTAVHEMSDAEVRAMFQTNFFGTLSTIRPALEHMLRAGAGHILICSSCLSKLAVPLHGIYSATKAAQDHVGRAMRLELAGTGVTVSTVHPIGTSTEFSASARARSGERDKTVRTPRTLVQPPERVATAIVRQLRRGRGGEVWTSLPMRLAFAVAVAMPRLADRVLRRAAHPAPSAADE